MKDKYSLSYGFDNHDLQADYQRREQIIQIMNLANQLVEQNRLKVLELQLKYGEQKSKDLCKKILERYTSYLKVEFSDILKEK